MKKIIFFLSTLFCLFLAAGCERVSEETTLPPARTANQYTLNYTAGANGSIDGISPQTVARGGTGSPVKAVPAEGYHFVRWSDGVDTGSRTDTEMGTDLAVTAEFAANQYTLSYTAAENGSIEGTSPQTVPHGGDGSPVTAVPAKDYHFAGWSDGLETASRTDRTVTADLEVTARFAGKQPTLTYTAGEHGSIKGASPQTVAPGGDGSPITALPDAGYRFAGWSDGVKTPNRTDSKVTADVTVTASFAPGQYTLSYTAGENGAVDGATQQSVKHGEAGSPVTAKAASGYHFTGWSDGVDTPGRTDSKVGADLAVTARFAINQHRLAYTAGKNGTIKGASAQGVDPGGSGSPVTAVPDAGYHFTGWSDGIKTPGRTDSKVKTDLAVTASFAIDQHRLSYTAEKHGSLDGVTPQEVAHGADATAVTAVAEKGYHFVSWSDGLTTAKRLDTKVTDDLTVSAAFAANTFTIGGRLSGLIKGTQVVLQNNAGDDLTITAAGDFKFAAEVSDAAPYAVTVLTQPASPNQICTVTGGAGKVSGKNVAEVAVACVPATYTIGVTVSGLPDGEQVVLRNNEADDLAITANGAFTFAAPLNDGSKYSVTVKTHPKKANWTCDVAQGAGTVAGKAVTDVVVDCYLEVALQPKAGIGKIKLTWNSQDFSGATFSLCRAQEKIASDSFDKCQDLKEGVLEKKVDSPLTVAQLTNDIPYWFQLEVQEAGGRKTLSKVMKAMPFGGLNDSGVDWCANDNANLFADGIGSEKAKGCDSVAASYPGQDAFHGRDASARARKLAKTGSGPAGFDFTRLCRNGTAAGEEKCPPNPAPGSGGNNWACTRDNVTGLIWENKTDNGLRSQDNTYTWHNPDKSTNGGKPGVKDGGKCEGSDCDTQSYVKAINKEGLCGANDWRLPTKRELLSIVDNSRFKPASTDMFFPDTLSANYWSSSPYPDQEDSAWQVYFLYGEASPNQKNQANHVRLVRGRTVTFGLDNP